MTKKTGTAKTAKRGSAADKGFTPEEKAAMKEAARERRAQASGANGEAEVKAKITAMKEPDRALAQRVHEIVMAAAPTLSPRTWYGMPAYAKNGNVVCFFQDAGKFKAKYSTLGFSDKAALDDGTMWPTSFALTRLTPADEARITALVRKAVG